MAKKRHIVVEAELLRRGTMVHPWCSIPAVFLTTADGDEHARPFRDARRTHPHHHCPQAHIIEVCYHHMRLPAALRLLAVPSVPCSKPCRHVGSTSRRPSCTCEKENNTQTKRETMKTIGVL